MTAATCVRCEAELASDAAFCEVCGQANAAIRDGEIGSRDHFGQQPTSWVAGVCDRGLDHARNEDAMALAATEPPGSHAALVVCDGVTSAANSDVAALAAARAALAILAAPFSRGLGGDASALVAGSRAFQRAVREAQNAVLRESQRNTSAPGACTFVAVVVAGETLWHAGIGDSRAYLVPDDGAAVMLTRDDSMAEALIEAGMPRADAERTPMAHTITRWLGADAPDLDPHAAQLDVPGPAWVVVCSDGLWNYASEPDALGRLVRQIAGETRGDPLMMARELVEWANAQGGHDNITAALARVGDA